MMCGQSNRHADSRTDRKRAKQACRFRAKRRHCGAFWGSGREREETYMQLVANGDPVLLCVVLAAKQLDLARAGR